MLQGHARVVNSLGVDVSAEFKAGALAALELARREGLKVAVLKEGSPSCGSGYIYDGTFLGNRVSEVGVAVAALRDLGVQVFSVKFGSDL